MPKVFFNNYKASVDVYTNCTHPCLKEAGSNFPEGGKLIYFEEV